MFGPLGGPELILILVVALIVFGPRKLPEIGKSMGKMLVEFRRASTEFKRTLETEVETEKRTGPRATPTTPSVPTGAAVPEVGATAGQASAAPSSDEGSPAPEGEDPEPGTPEESIPQTAAKPPAGGDS